MQYKEVSEAFVQRHSLFEKLLGIAHKQNIGVYLTGPAVIRCLNKSYSPLIQIVVDADPGSVITELARQEAEIAITEQDGNFFLQLHDSELIQVQRVKKFRTVTGEDEPLVPSLKEYCLHYGFDVLGLAISFRKRSLGKSFDYCEAAEKIESKSFSILVKSNVLRAEHGLYHAMLESEMPGGIADWLYPFWKEQKEQVQQTPRQLLTAVLMFTLSAPIPSKGLITLFHAGYMGTVFPEAENMAGVEQKKEYHHKDVFFHTCEVVDNLAKLSDNLWLRFAALVHDIAKPHTKRLVDGIGWTFHAHDEIGARVIKGVFRRLTLPQQHLSYIQKMIRLHLRPAALAKRGVTDSAIRRLITEAGEDVKELMQLCRADITSKNLSKVSRFLKNYDEIERRILEVNEKDKAAAFQSPVRGTEIMEICNIGPSKKVGQIKDAIESAILAGDIENNYEAALAYLLKIKDDYLK